MHAPSWPVAIGMLAAALLAQSAAAKDASVGGTMLALPPPAGQCAIDAAKGPSDARFLQVIEGLLANGSNRLLAATADCTELEDWRALRRPLLDNFAQYQTLIAWENGIPAAPDVTVSEICKQLRAQGEQFTAGAEKNVKARLEELLQEVKVNELRFLGVVGQEPLACYAAMLQRLRTEVGTDKTQVTVFATTVVRGKLVYFYLFAPYAGGDTVTDLLSRQRAHMQALRAANRN